MLPVIRDAIGPTSNVRISTYLDGVLQETRESHNILTNIGRKWLRDLVGALDYSNTDGNGFIEGTVNIRTSERARYIGLGVGGLLTSDAIVFNGTQEELVTVVAPEDYVKMDASNFLKQVEVQTDGSDGLPTNFSIRFIITILESEVSFEGNTSKSEVVVGTLVRVSEAGLYLSGADPTMDLDVFVNNSRMIAYSIFAPIPINPNIVTRFEWELRF